MAAHHNFSNIQTNMHTDSSRHTLLKADRLTSARKESEQPAGMHMQQLATHLQPVSNPAAGAAECNRSQNARQPGPKGKLQGTHCSSRPLPGCKQAASAYREADGQKSAPQQHTPLISGVCCSGFLQHDVGVLGVGARKATTTAFTDK
jgi:hypothetical protein